MLLLTIVITYNILRSLKKFVYFFLSLSLVNNLKSHYNVERRVIEFGTFLSVNQKKLIVLLLTIVILCNMMITFWEVCRSLLTFLSLFLSLLSIIWNHVIMLREEDNLILIDKSLELCIYLSKKIDRVIFNNCNFT